MERGSFETLKGPRRYYSTESRKRISRVNSTAGFQCRVIAYGQLRLFEHVLARNLDGSPDDRDGEPSVERSGDSL